MSLDSTILQSGILQIHMLSQINQLVQHLDSSCQTLVHYGFNSYDKSTLFDICIQCGIDRLVPPGQALNITNNWDGYDIISMLSRTISN